MREAIGLFLLLAAAATALKLEGVLDWSWLWVLAPPVACVVLAAVILRRP